MKKRKRKAGSHWTRLGKSVLPSPMSDDGKRRLRRRLAAGAILFMGMWLAFFDSHSFMKRISWHRDYSALQEENAALAAEIERLEREVDRGLSDEMVEKIAREHYGMRRDGETVYPVEED
ncbi:MAG: septum formation initiator family protein [Rhodothermales bacterium]